jgi:hypothetical protein
MVDSPVRVLVFPMSAEGNRNSEDAMNTDTWLLHDLMHATIERLPCCSRRNAPLSRTIILKAFDDIEHVYVEPKVKTKSKKSRC